MADERPTTHKNNGGEDQTVDPTTQQYRSMYASKEEIEELLGDKLTDEEYEAIKKAFPDPGETREEVKEPEQPKVDDGSDIEGIDWDGWDEVYGSIEAYVEFEQGLEVATQQVIDQIEDFFNEDVINDWVSEGCAMNIPLFEDENGFKKYGDPLINIIRKHRYGPAMVTVVSDQEFEQYEDVIRSLGGISPFSSHYDRTDSIRTRAGNQYGISKEGNQYAKLYRGLRVWNSDSKNPYETLKNIIKSHYGEHDSKGFLMDGIYGDVMYNSLSKQYSEDYIFNAASEGSVGRSKMLELIADLNNANVYELDKKRTYNGKTMTDRERVKKLFASRYSTIQSRLEKHFLSKGFGGMKSTRLANAVTDKIVYNPGYQAVLFGVDFMQVDKQLDALNISRVKMKGVNM